MSAFVDLPNELIQLIAGWCSASDIVVLRRTCRRLYVVCNTSAVYEMSFQIHLPNLTSTAFKDKAALVQVMKDYIDKTRPGDECSRMTWLCLAVAVSRLPYSLPELRNIASGLESKNWELDQDTEKSLRGLISFHATLPIWGCTTPWLGAELQDLFRFFMKRFRPDFGCETFLRFAFVMAMNTLGTHQPKDFPDQSIYEFAKWYLDIASQRGNQTGPQVSWIERQTSALLLAHYMARKLYIVSVHGGAGMAVFFSNPRRVVWVSHEDPAQLPNSKKIEFLNSWCFGSQRKEIEHMRHKGFTPLQPRFPLLTPHIQNGRIGRYFNPFCGDEWWSWYTARVRDLLRGIEEGEWCCSYVYVGNGRKSYAEPTLRGIRFRKATANGKEYLLEVPDGSMPFAARRMRGKVLVSDVEHTFSFPSRPGIFGEYSLYGSLTPLGICGVAVLMPQKVCGCFWLWRSEWMGL